MHTRARSLLSSFLSVLLMTTIMFSVFSEAESPTRLKLACYGVDGVYSILYFADGYHGGLFLTNIDEFVSASSKLFSLLDKYENYKVNLEIDSYSWEELARTHPELIRKFKIYIEDGRIELVSGSYAQPFLFPNLGESVIRQLQIGKEVIKNVFNYDVVTYAVQEPCFTSQLPQILNGLEYKHAVLKNHWCLYGNPPSINEDKVWWRGPDGSVIETSPRYSVQAIWDYFLRTYPTYTFLEDCQDANIKNPITFRLEDFNTRYIPWFNEQDILQKTPSWLKFTTWRDYFNETPEPTHYWNITQEDFEIRFPWGLVGGVVQQKARVAEISVLTAERIASLATLYTSKPYPGCLLDKAWKYTMLAQSHDSWVCAPILLGEWRDERLGVVYKDLVIEWSDLVAKITDEVISNSCRWIGDVVNTVPDFDEEIITPIIVFNPLGENRTDITAVSLSLTQATANSLKVYGINGEVVPSQIISSTRYDDGSLKEVTLIFLTNVPSLGYKTYYVAPSKLLEVASPFQLQISEDILKVESEFYSIIFDKAHGGCITSLYDRDLKKEFLDKSQGLGNDYIGWIPSLGDFSQSSNQPAIVTVIENGPVRVHIRIEGIYHDYPYVTHFYLYNGVKRIDFEVSFDFGTRASIGKPKDEGWQINDKKLQVAFPLSVENGDLWVDAPFDVFKVTNDSSYSLTWVDVSNQTLGLSLILDRPTALQYKNNSLSAILAYGGLLDCPWWSLEAFLSGNQTYKYSIYTHAGTWTDGKVPNVAEAYAYRSTATVTTVHEGEKPPVGSIISLIPQNQSVHMPIITALQCRNGGVYVRVYQPYAETEQIVLSTTSIELFNASDVYVVNLLGRRLYKPPINQQRISLTMDPYEVKTVKIASEVPVEKPPPLTISIVSPENKTYLVNYIPLTFVVSESASWIGYSLDGQANITITGNTTLSGLSDGPHNLIVFARDTAGNTGASEIVHFFVETRQQDIFSAWMMVIIGAVITAVIIAPIAIYWLLKGMKKGRLK